MARKTKKSVTEKLATLQRVKDHRTYLLTTTFMRMPHPDHLHLFPQMGMVRDTRPEALRSLKEAILATGETDIRATVIVNTMSDRSAWEIVQMADMTRRFQGTGVIPKELDQLIALSEISGGVQ